ncbi:MAG: glycosyltransferase family 4 protein [Nanobdellota archaeon]
MRICFISDVYQPCFGGIGVSVKNLAEGLSTYHDVSVITSGRPFQPHFERVNGVSVYRCNSLKFPKRNLYFAVPRKYTLKRLMNKMDVVHFHTISPLARLAYKVARGNGAKLVYTYHIAPEQYSWNSLLGHVTRRYVTHSIDLLCKRCDAVITLSQKIFNQLYLSYKVYHLSNVISINGGNMIKDTDFLYVGRLDREKGLFSLLRVFRHFVHSNPSATLRIVGEGPLQARLQRYVVSSGMERNVLFTGHIAHHSIGSEYGRSRIFILPSLIEQQGLVLLEAMRLSLPVICSASVYSAPDLIDPGRNGFLFEKEGDLLQCMKRLYRDPDLQARMGREGYDKSQNYVAEEVIPQYLNFYESLCGPDIHE